MIKSSPFVHDNFPKNNMYRKINHSFNSPINAVVYILNQSMPPNDRECYDIHSKQIHTFVNDNYLLRPSFVIEDLANILNVHIFVCFGEETVKSYGKPYDKSKIFIILQKMKNNFHCLVRNDGEFVFTYQQISFIFHKHGKIQSSLRNVNYTDLIQRAKESNIELKNKDSKKLNKLELFEHLFFLEN